MFALRSPLTTGAGLVRDLVADLVSQAVADSIAAGELTLAEIPAAEPERPRDPSHGDWATSIALRSAKAAGMKPRDIAEIIAAASPSTPTSHRVEVAGPGFINLRLAPVGPAARAARGARAGTPTSVASSWARASGSRSSSSRRTR